jgi:hypothetical protein
VAHRPIEPFAAISPVSGKELGSSSQYPFFRSSGKV